MLYDMQGKRLGICGKSIKQVLIWCKCKVNLVLILNFHRKLQVIPS